MTNQHLENQHKIFSRPLALNKLRLNKPFRETIKANPEERAKIAELADLISLDLLTVELTINGTDEQNWHLKGKLLARLTQECVATLKPVQTEINHRFERKFVRNPDEENEIEEKYTDSIDRGEIATEELMLNIPEYPRLSDTEYLDHIEDLATSDDVTEKTKAFAALEALKQKLPKSSK